MDIKRIIFFIFLMIFLTQKESVAAFYYAATVHESKHKNHLVTVTKTPNEATCEMVAKVKGGPNPMGDNKWFPVQAECQTENGYVFEAAFNKQPISEPYAWFIDKDSYPTVVKVMGFNPLFARTMVEGLAARIRSWGFKVDVIAPKK